jgi:hypothetical protein
MADQLYEVQGDTGAVIAPATHTRPCPAAYQMLGNLMELTNHIRSQL